MSNKTVRRRPSLGGANRKRPQSESLSQAGDALKRMETVQAFIDKDQRDVMYISPSDIHKTFNARFIPCTFAEFSAVAWPNLDENLETALDAYPLLLKDLSWFEALTSKQKEAFYSFMGKVHHTAQSMVNLLQAQPITLEREHEAATEYFIVDGERRTLSCLYTKGKIPVIKAQVFNRKLSSYERAMLKDVANTGEPLTTVENILSKKAIYESMPEAAEMNLRDLGKLLRISKNQAGWFKMLVTHPKQDALLKRIDSERLGWRQIKFILDNGVNAAIPIAKSAVDQKAKKSVSHRVTNVDKTRAKASGDELRLKTLIEEKIGYPCQVHQNTNNNKISLHFEVASSEFENLLANLKPIEIDE